jgi:hypothetical protein
MNLTLSVTDIPAYFQLGTTPYTIYKSRTQGCFRVLRQPGDAGL